MNTVRWLLLVPAAVAVWYGFFVAGLVTHSLIESKLCPPAELISGFCTNETVRLCLKVTEHLFVAGSAFAVVTTTTFLAPRHKRITVWATLAIGIAAAAYLGTIIGGWRLFASAAAGGLAGVAINLLRMKHASLNNALQVTREDTRA
jgi:uncharacterized membrane protein YoaK (UPF0700 family)